MPGNVVEILVKASDDTAGGFGKAKASAVSSADEIAAAQDKVTEAENKLRDAQIRQTDAQLKLEELQQSGTAKADELAAAQDKVTAATLRAADAQIRLGAADATLAEKEALAGDAGAVQAEKVSLTSRLSGVAGAGLAKFGQVGSLALAGIGYESIKMAMSFQQATERLVTQAGVPQKELGNLRSGVLNLAGAVGFSPDSLATSLYHVASNMASLGATAPTMLNAVKIAAEGAKVGGANLEDVTNALTAAISSGIPGVQNFGQAMGSLNAIVGAGDMKMQDLAEAMSTGVLAVVKGYGLSLKDVGAALAVFGDNNIRGAAAATDLRMAVMSLSTPAAAGKKALEGIGLTMTSLGTTMRNHGMLAALEELQAHFKAAGITAKEQGGVITEIFGKKAGTGLNVLMDQMDRLKSKYPDIEHGAKNFGKAWEATQQTTRQKLDELRATFESLGTAIGSKLLPVISAFAGFLDRNRAVLQTLAPVILAVVAAFTAWAAIMKVIAIVSDLNPWTLAIMAVIAVVVLLVEHWKTVERVAKEVFDAVVHAIEVAFDWVKSHWPLILGILLGPIALAAGEIIQHWHAIYDGAVRMIHDVVSWFERLPGLILNAISALPGMMFRAGVNVIQHLIDGFLSMVGSVGSAIGGIAKKVAGFFGLSPAVEGPLSGGGAPEVRGQHFAADLARGMLSGHSAVASAASRLAGGAAIGPAGGGYGAAGAAGRPLTIQITPGGGSSGLEQQFWTWLKGGVRAQGGDPRIFNRKVQFI